jgi:Mn-dependent DtxR family transcriptional regulator
MKVDEKELNRLRKIGETMNVSKRTVKIWEKNLKQGYRFFQPHNATQLTPRTLREAYGTKNFGK